MQAVDRRGRSLVSVLPAGSESPNSYKLFNRLASSFWVHQRDNVQDKLHL